MQNKGMIFFHRGAHGKGIPENSLASFRNAVGAGFGIEIDVRLSSDGVPVVFHDKTLRRMCGDKRRVDELTVSELKKFRLSGTGETIPTLKETLDTVGGRVPLLIETKPPKKRLLDMSLERGILAVMKGYRGEYLLQSFDKRSMRYLRRRTDGILCGILSGRHYPEPVGFDFVSYRLSELDKQKVSLLRKKYPLVLAWSTADLSLDEGTADMERLGIDGIIGNF